MSRIPGTRKRRPPILVGLPSIPDNASDEIKDALAVGNATAVTGECPTCGARPKVVAYPELAIVRVVFLHDPDCPVAALLDPDDP